MPPSHSRCWAPLGFAPPQCALARKHKRFGTSSRQPARLWDAPCEQSLRVPPAPFCRGAAPSLGLSRSQDTERHRPTPAALQGLPEMLGQLLEPWGQQAAAPRHSQPCPCTARHSQGLLCLHLGSWGSRGDVGGQRGSEGDCAKCPSDAAAAPRRCSRPCPCPRPARVRTGCAFLLPQHSLFSVKPGPQR